MFMGTPFLSDISFTRYPQTLDISEVGVYVDGSWQNPRKKFMKILLSVDLSKIRDQYLVVPRAFGERQTDGFDGIFIEYDNNNDKMILRVGAEPNPLLIVINYGATQYTETYSIAVCLSFAARSPLPSFPRSPSIGRARGISSSLPPTGITTARPPQSAQT